MSAGKTQQIGRRPNQTSRSFLHIFTYNKFHISQPTEAITTTKTTKTAYNKTKTTKRTKRTTKTNKTNQQNPRKPKETVLQRSKPRSRRRPWMPMLPCRWRWSVSELPAEYKRSVAGAVFFAAFFLAFLAFFFVERVMILYIYI